jgi:hypothetical protein
LIGIFVALLGTARFAWVSFSLDAEAEGPVYSAGQ